MFDGFRVTAFSGWPLGCTAYPMTRTALSELGDILPLNSDISVQMLELLNSELEIEGEMMDRFINSVKLITEHPHGPMRPQGGLYEQAGSLEERLAALSEPLETNVFINIEDQLDSLDVLIKGSNPLIFGFDYYGKFRKFECSSTSNIQVYQLDLFENPVLELEIEFNDNFPVILFQYTTNILQLELTNAGYESEAGTGLILNAETSRFNISGESIKGSYPSLTGTLLLSKLERREFPSGPVFNGIQTEVWIEPVELAGKFGEIIDPIVTEQKIHSNITSTALLNSRLLFIFENLLKRSYELELENISFNLIFKQKSDDGSRNHLSFEIEEINDIEELVKYIKALRIVQFDLLAYFLGSNGGSFRNLPPALYLALDTFALSPAGISVNISSSDRLQFSEFVYRARLDRILGTDEIYSIQSGGLEIYISQMNTGDKLYYLRYE
jgi:hypothetical protein